MKAKELKAIKEGKLTVDELLEIYPVKVLVNDLIEMVLAKPAPVVAEQPKITVTTQEWEQISNLFRIKGSSNRGRKPSKKDE